MDALASVGRLGAVLVQVPMSFHATEENRALLERIFETFAAYPLAAEFRHFSWDSPATLRFLEGRSVGFVNIDQPRLKGNLPATSHVTSSVAYYRFHGRNAAKWFGPDTSNEERYDYLYDEKELKPWAERIRERPPDTNAFAVMNNHFRGQAVANALQLQQMLTGEAREAPESLARTFPRAGLSFRARPQKSLF
jgi:uncharacterized protein YecE (DUF72 family)